MACSNGKVGAAKNWSFLEIVCADVRYRKWKCLVCYLNSWQFHMINSKCFVAILPHWWTNTYHCSLRVGLHLHKNADSKGRTLPKLETSILIVHEVEQEASTSATWYISGKYWFSQRWFIIQCASQQLWNLTKGVCGMNPLESFDAFLGKKVVKKSNNWKMTSNGLD